MAAADRKRGRLARRQLRKQALRKETRRQSGIPSTVCPERRCRHMLSLLDWLDQAWPHAMATIMPPNATKPLRNGNANDSTSEVGTFKSIWPRPCQAHRRYVCMGSMRSKARMHGFGNARVHGLGPSCALGRMTRCTEMHKSWTTSASAVWW